MKVDRVIKDIRKSLETVLRAFDNGLTPEDNMGPTRATAGYVLTSVNPDRKPAWQPAGTGTGAVDLSNIYTKAQVDSLIGAINLSDPVGWITQFGDGVNAITASGYEIESIAAWSGQITRIILDADAACSAVVDIKRNGASIFGGTSVKPTLSSSQTDDKTNMTDVTVAVVIGDKFVAHVDSVGGSPKRLTIAVFVTRS